MFPSSSSSAPSPALWLHPCHGRDVTQLAPATVKRTGSESVAEAFTASHVLESTLGLQCNLDGLSLVVQGADSESIVIVQSVLLAEVSCCLLPSDAYPDLALAAIVPPLPGLGIRGTSIAAIEPINQVTGWFLVVQGSVGWDFLDILSTRGCLRTDFETSFTMASAEKDCVIGEGAYATVLQMKARSGHEVAVKQMNATSDLESIEREVTALVELQGDNIIGFRGIFWRMEMEQVRFFGVFDLAPGGDLLYQVLRVGMMTEAIARPLFMGILRGLKRMHDLDIVHRDIKTENILLQAGDVPMVADFGLACRLSDEQQMSRRCGSAGFVAPEVCLGNPYDCKVDNFGAGVILYFMLSKEMPFSSPDRDSAATMRKTVKCSLHLQRAPFSAMTSRLRNILRQLICKSQEDRLSADAALQHSWIAGKFDKTGSSSSSKKKDVVLGEGPTGKPLAEELRHEVSEASPGDAAATGGYSLSPSPQDISAPGNGPADLDTQQAAAIAEA